LKHETVSQIVFLGLPLRVSAVMPALTIVYRLYK
jgi:hypothetical protein